MSRRDTSLDAAPVAARGRPARSPFESARAKSWARAVVQMSGLSLRALDRHCQAAGSGQWSKYVAGRVSPTTEKLDIVEALVPGSSRCYLSPLWELLDPKALGLFGPRKIYEWLDEPLRSKFRSDMFRDTHEAITTQNRERLAYTSVALWILSNRLYDDERMMEGLWAALPERHIRAFARNTLGLVGELGVDAHLQEATRSIREIQRNAL